MRRDHEILAFVSLGLLLRAVPLPGYEDNTHQQLTKRSLVVAAIKAPSLPGDFASPNGDIGSLGRQVIAGAGKGPDEAPPGDRDPAKTDGEDYTDYDIQKCPLKVKPRVHRFEPLNHFLTGMLRHGPALNMFIKFYRDAVDLWKKDKRGEAAFILGRAIHLIEDMAQPQHAMDEAHLSWDVLRATSGWKRTVYNPSFVEFFAEAHIQDRTGQRTTPEYALCEYNVLQTSYVDYTPLIAGLDAFGCDGCLSFGDYFRNAVDASKDSVYLSPDNSSGLLVRQFTSAQMESWFNVTPQYPMFTPLPSTMDLPFQYVRAAGCDTKMYRDAVGLYHKPDYWRTGDQSGTVRSIDFGFRLKEADLGAAEFADWHTGALLKPAVADAAGLIAYFWNEVKNLPLVPPKPCDGPSPAKDFPDDSVMVKASSALESSEMPASFDWQNLCRVGIGKGLGSMADYGVSSSLMDQLAAMGPNADPAVAEALYARLESLEGKYSGPQNVMPHEVEWAPVVAIWEKGFGDSARSLIEGMREPVKMLEEPQEPVFTDEESLALLPPHRGLLDADVSKQKILVLPTGSLFGLRAASMERQGLQSFVEAGGVVVCFTQAYGDDFSALPLPAGQTLG
jgi:hypothetical protein